MFPDHFIIIQSRHWFICWAFNRVKEVQNLLFTFKIANRISSIFAIQWCFISTNDTPPKLSTLNVSFIFDFNRNDVSSWLASIRHWLKWDLLDFISKFDLKLFISFFVRFMHIKLYPQILFHKFYSFVSHAYIINQVLNNHIQVLILCWHLGNAIISFRLCNADCFLENLIGSFFFFLFFKRVVWWKETWLSKIWDSKFRLKLRFSQRRSPLLNFITQSLLYLGQINSSIWDISFHLLKYNVHHLV